MFNSKIPSDSELPSSRRLLRSTLLAFGAACAILFLFVLPAEYGYDLTGAGRLLGLTKMGEVKLALLKETQSTQPNATPELAASRPKTGGTDGGGATHGNAARTMNLSGPANAAAKRGELTLVLNPGEAVEVKLEMLKGARISYSWETTGGSLNFDTHGDPSEDPNGYHRYSKGVMTQRDKGELVAVFDGWHGWFWRNRDKGPVSVTLRYEGDFLSFKKVKKS
jgi:hypothetical protein